MLGMRAPLSELFRRRGQNKEEEGGAAKPAAEGGNSTLANEDEQENDGSVLSETPSANVPAKTGGGHGELPGKGSQALGIGSITVTEIQDEPPSHVSKLADTQRWVTQNVDSLAWNGAADVARPQTAPPRRYAAGEADAAVGVPGNGESPLRKSLREGRLQKPAMTPTNEGTPRGRSRGKTKEDEGAEAQSDIESYVSKTSYSSFRKARRAEREKARSQRERGRAENTIDELDGKGGMYSEWSEDEGGNSTRSARRGTTSRSRTPPPTRSTNADRWGGWRPGQQPQGTEKALPGAADTNVAASMPEITEISTSLSHNSGVQPPTISPTPAGSPPSGPVNKSVDRGVVATDGTSSGTLNATQSGAPVTRRSYWSTSRSTQAPDEGVAEANGGKSRLSVRRALYKGSRSARGGDEQPDAADLPSSVPSGMAALREYGKARSISMNTVTNGQDGPASDINKMSNDRFALSSKLARLRKVLSGGMSQHQYHAQQAVLSQQRLPALPSQPEEVSGAFAGAPGHKVEELADAGEIPGVTEDERRILLEAGEISEADTTKLSSVNSGKSKRSATKSRKPKKGADGSDSSRPSTPHLPQSPMSSISGTPNKDPTPQQIVAWRQDTAMQHQGNGNLPTDFPLERSSPRPNARMPSRNTKGEWDMVSIDVTPKRRGGGGGGVVSRRGEEGPSLKTWKMALTPRSEEERSRIGAIGLITFWLGFCLASFVCEVERRRLEAELMKERDSATFLAQVAALEWSRKQEAQRERISATRELELSLDNTSKTGAVALLENGSAEEGSEGNEGSAKTRRSLDFDGHGETAASPAGTKGGSFKAASGPVSLTGDERLAALGEVEEHVRVLEEELDNTRADLEDVLAELEACRADLDGLEMTRHKVKTLRVCLELARESEAKSSGEVEEMREQLGNAEGQVARKSKEVKKLKQENATMKRTLGALFLHVAMPAAMKAGSQSGGEPASPRGLPKLQASSPMLGSRRRI